jgi:type VI protein secretion system component Hcp
VEHDLAGRQTAAPSQRSRAARSPGNPVLALQRQIGNRATQALLARETATQPRYTAKLSGIGTIALESFSFGVAKPSVGSDGAGRDGPKAETRELHFDSVVGDHSPELFRHSASGIVVKEVEIVLRKQGNAYLTIKLKNAHVVSYSTGSGGGQAGEKHESWSLAYESIEYKDGTLSE